MNAALTLIGIALLWHIIFGNHHRHDQQGKLMRLIEINSCNKCPYHRTKDCETEPQFPKWIRHWCGIKGCYITEDIKIPDWCPLEKSLKYSGMSMGASVGPINPETRQMFDEIMGTPPAGMAYSQEDADLIIKIMGQNSKVIVLEPAGKPKDEKPKVPDRFDLIDEE